MQYVNEQASNQLQLLEKLVNINSGTTNPEGVQKVGDLLIPQFEALGFTTRWQPLPQNMHHAGSLIAELQSKPGPSILLIGHLDTVFPHDSHFQHFSLTSDGKWATGPGVIDDKGGLVTILYALKALKQVGALKQANIIVVITGDEEFAAKPTEISRKALVNAAQKSTIALGFEFALSPNELVIGRRGLSEWILRSSGQAQHSSTVFGPQSGFGAIYEQARVLNEIQRALSSTPGLTINPGLQLGGQTLQENAEQENGTVSGKKTIIAAQAMTRGDLRYLTNQQRDKAQQNMIAIANYALAGARSSFEFHSIIPVMEPSEANQTLLTEFNAISKSLQGPTLQAIPPEQRGGADISYVADVVAANLDGLGPWGHGAHSEQETLEVASLSIATQRATLFLLQTISKH